AFVLGLWRGGFLADNLADYRTYVDSIKLRYHRDGAGSTVAVVASQRPDGSEQLALRVNGKTDATSQGDLSTQVLLAHLPALVKPDWRDALVVGLGSGVTAGSLLQHSSVTNVDVVEISPEVVAAARGFFGPFNDHALDDARVRL